MRSRPAVVRLVVLVTSLLVLATSMTLGRASAPSYRAVATAASVRLGHDISWPQCGTGHAATIATQLPAGHAPFLILGLTNGTAMHDNPCLAGQLRYGAAHADHVAVYLMANRPTAAELAAAARTLPASCPSGRLCAMRQAGVLEATSALATLARHGYATTLAWIDVETRRTQPWSRSDVAGNQAVLRGIGAGLEAAGVAPGYYSTKALWHQIAGTMRVPGAATWYALGRSSRAGLVSACGKTFGSGTTVITQAVIGRFDADQLCRTSRAGSVLTAMTVHPVVAAVPVVPTLAPVAQATAPATAAPAPAPMATAVSASPSASPSPTGPLGLPGGLGVAP